MCVDGKRALKNILNQILYLIQIILCRTVVPYKCLLKKSRGGDVRQDKKGRV